MARVANNTSSNTIDVEYTNNAKDIADVADSHNFYEFLKNASQPNLVFTPQPRAINKSSEVGDISGIFEKLAGIVSSCEQRSEGLSLLHNLAFCLSKNQSFSFEVASEGSDSGQSSLEGNQCNKENRIYPKADFREGWKQSDVVQENEEPLDDPIPVDNMRKIVITGAVNPLDTKTCFQVSNVEPCVNHFQKPSTPTSVQANFWPMAQSTPREPNNKTPTEGLQE